MCTMLAVACSLVPALSGAAPAPAPGSTAIVYTRAMDEAPFITRWVEWYLDLGFRSILILDTSRTPEAKRELRQQAMAARGASSAVRVLSQPTDVHPDMLLAQAASVVEQERRRVGAAWALGVDLDEYLLLDGGATIEAHIERATRACDGLRPHVIQFRWVMVQHLKQSCASFGGPGVLRRAFVSHFVKSMTRPVDGLVTLDSVNAHFPRVHNSSATGPRGVRAFRDNTCHDNVAGRVRIGELFRDKEGLYADSVLVHVHTRSVRDLLRKAALTGVGLKQMRNTTQMAAMLLNASATAELPTDIDALTAVIGWKASKPLQDMSVGCKLTDMLERSTGARNGEAGLSSRRLAARVRALARARHTKLVTVPARAKSPLCNDTLEAEGFLRTMADLFRAAGLAPSDPAVLRSLVAKPTTRLVVAMAKIYAAETRRLLLGGSPSELPSGCARNVYRAWLSQLKKMGRGCVGTVNPHLCR